LEDGVQLTSDHVFPKSWYPDTTPKYEYKWQVPACYSCNSNYGKIERDLLIRFALCLNPNDPDNASIVAKGKRSIDPKFGKNKKDRKARLDKRKSILSQIWKGQDIPSESIYPNLGYHPEVSPDEEIALPIPADGLEKLARKIVRGITHIKNGLFIEDTYEISFFAISNDDSLFLKNILKKHGSIIAVEPGISVNRAIIKDDPVSAIFEIVMWKVVKMHCIVRRKKDGTNSVKEAVEDQDYMGETSASET